MNNIFFTSDTHFFHRNIIEYSNRPFVDLFHMNESLIYNWNTVVKNEDTVFHLGDFSFGNREETEGILSRLKGNICLIKGNHDKKSYVRFEFEKIYYELKIKHPFPFQNRDLFIIMFHYPMVTWNGKTHGSIHLHGHSHGSLPLTNDQKRIDVGVDVWNYTPVSLLDIARKEQKMFDRNRKQE